MKTQYNYKLNMGGGILYTALRLLVFEIFMDKPSMKTVRSIFFSLISIELIVQFDTISSMSLKHIGMFLSMVQQYISDTSS